MAPSPRPSYGLVQMQFNVFFACGTVSSALLLPFSRASQMLFAPALLLCPLPPAPRLHAAADDRVLPLGLVRLAPQLRAPS